MAIKIQKSDFARFPSPSQLAIREVKKRAKPRHLEDDLQRDCVRWFRLQYPNRIIFAIPNGGKRNAREAARMKAQGVMAGVPDLMITHPMGGFYGLFIELKVGKNKVSPEQKMLMASLGLYGYSTHVVYSFDEFMKIVKWYFEGK